MYQRLLSIRTAPDLASVMLEISERLTDLANALGDVGPDRVTMDAERAEQWRGLLAAIDDLIGETRDDDDEARAAATREYRGYVREHKLRARDVL